MEQPTWLYCAQETIESAGHLTQDSWNGVIVRQCVWQHCCGSQIAAAVTALHAGVLISCHSTRRRFAVPLMHSPAALRV